MNDEVSERTCVVTSVCASVSLCFLDMLHSYCTSLALVVDDSMTLLILK